MKIDMWYGNSRNDIAALTVTFYPNSGYYAGNFFDKDGKFIGDYQTADSVELQRTFPKLVNFGG
jgi:hypothetical protein